MVVNDATQSDESSASAQRTGAIQTRLRRSLKYRGSGNPEELLGDLYQLHKFDSESEAQQSKWMKLMLLAASCMVCGSVIAGALRYPAVAITIFLISLIATIVCFISYRKHGRVNVEDRRFKLPRKVLELLRVDIAKAHPCTLEIDFGAFTDKKNLTHQGEAGHWSVKYYTAPWLSLNGRFADGSVFQLAHSHLHQARSRWKRSRSGKSKYKSKTKTSHVLELRLKFKPSRYQHMATLQQDAFEAVQLPPGAEIKNLRYTDREIGLKVGIKTDWNPSDGKNLIAMMFLSLYQILNLSKAIDKAGASGNQA